MIRCRTCEIPKADEDFNRSTKSKTGRQGECRECATERLRLEYGALSQEENRERWARQRAHRKTRPDLYYWVRIRSVFNLSKDQFEAILSRQDGCCAICHSAEPGGRTGRWMVDHDHKCCPGVKSCGRCVRGLLCVRCNLGLGGFGDDPDALLQAVKYLRAHEDRLVEIDHD